MADAVSLSLSDDLDEVDNGGDDPENVFQVLLLGDSGVGKTDLIGRLTEENFKTKFVATIGINVESRYLEVDEKMVKLQIWDPSGSDRFRKVISDSFSHAEGVLFVYDVSYRKSFLSIKNWMAEIQNLTHSLSSAKILIGNKCDIVDRRSVTFEEGHTLAQSYGIRFMETSTISGENVREAFILLCQEIKGNRERSTSSETLLSSSTLATN